jgi:hypothetical protein
MISNENFSLSEEEKKIVNDLEGLLQAKIKNLEDSTAAEDKKTISAFCALFSQN